MKKRFLIILTVIMAIAIKGIAQETGSFTDIRDGQTYKTVKIGKQIWMAENLNFYTRKSYYYNFDSLANSKYGRLYTYDLALRVCPKGWHLPKKTEWEELIKYLGGTKAAASKMAMQGTWVYNFTGNSINSTNSSGFTALPCSGFQYDSCYIETKEVYRTSGYTMVEKIPHYGNFMYHPGGIGTDAWWWFDNENKKNKAIVMNSNLIRFWHRDESFSNCVRCLKD